MVMKRRREVRVISWLHGPMMPSMHPCRHNSLPRWFNYRTGSVRRTKGTWAERGCGVPTCVAWSWCHRAANVNLQTPSSACHNAGSLRGLHVGFPVASAA